MTAVYRHALVKGSDSGVRNLVFEIDDGAELTALTAAFLAGDDTFEIPTSNTVLLLRDIVSITAATLADFDAWKLRWNRIPVSSTDGRVQERVRMMAIEAALVAQAEYTVADDLYGARATNLFIVNENNTARTVTFEIVPNGSGIGSGTNFLRDVPLAKDESLIVSGDLFMEPGDLIAITASGTGVKVVMSGWEIR